MRITLLHNPGAGEGQDRGEKLIRKIRKAGYEVAAHSGHEVDYEAALADPGDLVVVAGGDGTVGRAARALVGRGAPIAVLPSGTANNLAKSLGIVGLEDDLIAGWKRDVRVRVDVGEVEGPWGRKLFLEGVGAGLLPALMRYAAQHQEKAEQIEEGQGLGGFAEVLEEMTAASAPSPWRLVLDGEPVEGDFLLWEALNLRYIGPNLVLAPHADPGDGLLDVALVRAEEREALQSLLAQRARGGAPAGALTVRQARVVEVRAMGAQIHIDDRLYPEAPPEPGDAPGSVHTLRIGLLPGAVEFLLPR